MRSLRLGPEAEIDNGLTLQMGSIQEELRVVAKGKPAVAAAAAPKRIRVGGNVQASRLVSQLRPVYPESAKAAGVHGSVLLRAVVLMDGTPGGIKVISSPSEELSKASVEAVRQWRYSPTMLNGKPVEVVTDITVNYSLE